MACKNVLNYNKGNVVSILNKQRGSNHNRWVCINYSKETKFAIFGFSIKGPLYNHMSPLYAGIHPKMLKVIIKYICLGDYLKIKTKTLSLWSQ